ncbi:hypothetical protein RD110_06305 [Rhodoferax koreense]|uniref:Hemolysin III n=1 Tax=Rhodoferax koreensis TaxID=1842727 RepID=A0A1P8JSW4_9BURK|nr:hemolysin III family protein [Rhodoferax koreense]APW36852.1 hypothetical protein RD110_06305 [Rhodoferax koreense]
MYHGERFNSYSHLLGLAAVLAAAAALFDHVWRTGTATEMAGVGAFAASSAALYVASLLFHSSRGARKQWWQRADHAAIFMLIAGSYTAFALPVRQGATEGFFLCVVWLCATIGAAREMAGSRRPTLWLYVGLGWLCVFGALSFASRLGNAGTAWLLAGAAFYSAGTYFYRNRAGWAHAHGMWHLFVVAGTISHYVALAFTLKLWRA